MPTLQLIFQTVDRRITPQIHDTPEASEPCFSRRRGRVGYSLFAKTVGRPFAWQMMDRPFHGRIGTLLIKSCLKNVSRRVG